MSDVSKQKRILNVKTIREIDNDPSYFDYLGKFSNEPGPVERTIDRKATMKDPMNLYCSFALDFDGTCVG